MKEKILQLKLRKECGHPRALLCTRRGAGGCGLRWRLLLPCKDREKEHGGHHCFLRCLLYGIECQDTEPGQKGTDARSYGRLSNGAYGEARTDSKNEISTRISQLYVTSTPRRSKISSRVHTACGILRNSSCPPDEEQMSATLVDLFRECGFN